MSDQIPGYWPACGTYGAVLLLHAGKELNILLLVLLSCVNWNKRYPHSPQKQTKTNKNATPRHTTALHCTTLHYTTLHYTTLHYTTLHYTTLHLHYTTLHYTLHYTTLHYLHYCTALHCTALHYTTLHLHYTTLTLLHCTALHCTALCYCTTLHYTTLHHYITQIAHHIYDWHVLFDECQVTVLFMIKKISKFDFVISLQGYTVKKIFGA